ncbi:MAG: hypothetical protein RR014_01155, partial [Bilophila sp.]
MKSPRTASWLPLKSLFVLGVLSCLFLSAFLGIWYSTRALQTDIVILNNTLQTQELLQPLMHELTNYLDESQQRINTHTPLPAPNNLSQVLDALKELATQAGVVDARFVPRAETVLTAANSIRLEGQFSGTLEQLRCFALLLEAQPW